MNCRKGDLAIIVAPCIQSNLGGLVEVIGPWIGEGADRNSWWVRSLGRPMLRVDGRTAMEGAVKDTGLRPLRPGPTPVETEIILAAVA